jgi:hypothetical protein
MARLDRQARRDKYEKPDKMEPALAAEPTESTEATEPAEPIDRIDPAEPMDRIEPVEPIDRIDPLDPILSSDPADPADDESRLVCMIAFSQHRPISDRTRRAWPRGRRYRARVLPRALLLAAPGPARRGRPLAGPARRLLGERAPLPWRAPGRTAVIDGDRVVHEVRYAHPVQAVWHALTDPRELTA